MRLCAPPAAFCQICSPSSAHTLCPYAQLELSDRIILNLISFFGSHLTTAGTRGAEDQNIYDAILAALVDGHMTQDKTINAAATLLGVRWHAVKTAVLRRVKLDDEETRASDGIWTRRPRSERVDKYFTLCQVSTSSVTTRSSSASARGAPRRCASTPATVSQAAG